MSTELVICVANLYQIAEVKNYFVVHKKELENNYEKIKQSKPRTAIDGPAFLFNASAPLSDEELRAALPPKQAVDKLVTRYFNSHDAAVHILHSPTFHQELHDHWVDPSKTSIVWLGLLNAILSLAMQSYHKIGDEPLDWKGMFISNHCSVDHVDVSRSNAGSRCRISTTNCAVPGQ
jgi:hypothetical protein